MNIEHNRKRDEFFRFLYKKPKDIVSETDIVMNDIICYTKDIARLMNTQGFKRMNKIFQLGTKFLENNKLIHSRAQHSKGTYERTLQLCMHILEDKNIKGMVEKHNYEKYIVAELIRALLHDIGHGPFSHTMETICNLPKGFHEEIGKRIINENSEIRKSLDAIWPDLPNLIKEVEERNFLGLNSLFEGQLDVDRGDFLPRDSWYMKMEDTNSDEIKNILHSISIQKILVNGKGKLVPVFTGESLPQIENFLNTRYNNYQKQYYSSSGKLFEYIYKEFSEELLASEEEYPLKTFLKNNYNKTPEEINLEEYIHYNDIEFLKGILEVYDNTKDEKLKNLARVCIPDGSSYYPLYYGLMVNNEDANEYGNITLSREDLNLFNRIKNIPEYSTTDLINEKYAIKKCKNQKDLKYRLREIKKLLNIKGNFDFEDYGIVYDISRNNLYKNKPGEEIYVSDEEGKVYTFDTHPKRTIPLKKFTNATIIVDKDKLKENVKNERVIDSILDIVKNVRRDNTDCENTER